jgi:hypothetical protein
MTLTCAGPTTYILPHLDKSRAWALKTVKNMAETIEDRPTKKLKTSHDVAEETEL